MSEQEAIKSADELANWAFEIGLSSKIAYVVFRQVDRSYAYIAWDSGGKNIATDRVVHIAWI